MTARLFTRLPVTVYGNVPYIVETVNQYNRNILHMSLVNKCFVAKFE